MADGISTAAANAALDSLNAAYPWVKLHTGAPGAAGTSNAAANATRHQASDAAASGGASATDADLVWTAGEVTTSESYTHFTRWTASTAGTFGYSGSVSNGNVTSGTSFTIEAGDMTAAFTVAS